MHHINDLLEMSLVLIFPLNTLCNFVIYDACTFRTLCWYNVPEFGRPIIFPIPLFVSSSFSHSINTTWCNSAYFHFLSQKSMRNGRFVLMTNHQANEKYFHDNQNYQEGAQFPSSGITKKCHSF